MYATVTLMGTYLKPDRTPATGVIEIIPSERIIVDMEGNVVLSGRVKVPLDETGSFSVELPATDDPSLEPTGFGYIVVPKLGHTNLSAVPIQLPAAEATVDMAKVTPVPLSTFDPTTTYLNIILEATAARDAALLAESSAELAEANAEQAEANAQTAATAAAAAQTEAETALAGSESERAAAEAAQAAAESALSAAVAARTAAEAARTAAETARAGAESAQVAAEAAEGGAETAQTGAQTARTGAETARTQAQAAEANAETAAAAANTSAQDAQAALVAIEPNELTIGTVTASASGSAPQVTITGTAPHQTLSFVLPRGDKGDTGDPGPAGVDGKTVRNGAGAPAPGLGVDGDFYIDTTAKAIYGPKTAGAWGSATSLIGPAGGGGSSTVTRKVLAADVSEPGTGMVAISGLTFPGLTPGVYEIRATLLWKATSTGGIQLNFGATSSSGSNTINARFVTASTGSTAVSGIAQTSSPAGSSTHLMEAKYQTGFSGVGYWNVQSANVPVLMTVEGLLVVGGGMSFHLQMANNAGSGSVTMMAGSKVELDKV